MSEYKSERLQLNQIITLLSLEDYSSINISYTVFSDVFFFSITSKDGYVTNNLVTQKNEIRTFKSMKSLCNTMGFDEETMDIFKLIIV